MAVLAATKADLLACETIPSLLEARALARLLAEFPARTAWISFSCRDGEHTNHGERLADCAALLDRYDQVAAIGINCTPPRCVPDLIRAARSATGKSIVAYPNSGETYLPEEGCWSGDRDDARSYADQARHWYDRGARIIGCCCRTTPEDIRAIAAWARPRESRAESAATPP
jgi:homocysteine S-methyltransferase